MFKQYKMGAQPDTMTVIAQATWNEDKGLWEVHIVQSNTRRSGFNKDFSMSQTTHHVEVEDCDEFVIADALLHVNGISVQKLYQTSINPIVSGK